MVKSDLTVIPRWGSRVFAGLIGLYVAQTAALYVGGPDERAVLSAPARVGLALFRRHACQSCHQVHGLGGFLGPDLTNVVRRRSEEEIATVLANGRRQMPRFRLTDSEVEALVSYLEEIDRTGLSTASWRPASIAAVDWPREFAFGRSAGTWLPERVREGEALLRASGCGACHRPFAAGVAGAPDLTLARSRRSREQALAQIESGSGAMPGFPHLSAAERGALVDYVWWIGAQRARLAREVAGPAPRFRWSEVPWFAID